MEFKDPGAEVKDLQRCMNDLVSVLALPALWNGRGPDHILTTCLDALSATLGLDFLYSRVTLETGKAPFEAIRVAQAPEPTYDPGEIRSFLNHRFGDDARQWPAEIRTRLGDKEVSIVTMRLGLEGEIGIVIAGSQRSDFPRQTEKLILSTTANQLVVGLQQARLLNEQKRIADELERRVTERTTRLAATNEELSREITERERVEAALRDSEQSFRLIVDGIAGLVAIMTADGETEVVNRQVLDYFGKSVEELRGWSSADSVHPDDLPSVITAWRHSLETGAVYDVDHRLRRADGKYRWFHARGLPLRNGDGGVLRWYVLLTDIEDRKQAEETLRQSSDRFRSILDGLPAFVSLMTPSGEAEFCNRTALEYFGATLEEAILWPSGSTLHRDDVDACLAAWKHAVETGQSFDGEARHRRSDGAYRWFHMRGAPLRDADGQIALWYLLQVDVDDRKRAEGALAENERMLASIINTIPTTAWSTQPDGFCDFLNQRWLDYAGMSAEEARGWGWGAAVHPDDVTALVEHWQSSLASGKPVDTEARMRRGDGAYRWFIFRANPLHDESGKIIKWYGTNIDIDDRKRAEEQLRQSEDFLAEAQHLTNVGSFAWCVSTEEIRWSEQLYRIFEFEPGAAVTFAAIGERVHPNDLSLLADMIEKARRAVTHLEYEHRILMPDGSVKYLHLIAHATHDQEGRLEYIGAVQDVTLRRIADEALTMARQELDRVTRMTSLGMLTASIAHEVNQPLSGIVTNASTCMRMLDSDPPNIDGARETVRRTIRDGNRASEVITRLRALFRKKEVATEAVDLNETAREVIAMSAIELQKNRVILKDELADNLSPVQGDRIQLQQVILNLLRNASDAMSSVNDRPRELLVKTERSGNDGVRLSVKDAGVGFAPQLGERLFEGFYTTKSDGMGIGLSVSRSIIEAHQGRLWATLNDGPGATFTFSIPCVGAAAGGGIDDMPIAENSV